MFTNMYGLKIFLLYMKFNFLNKSLILCILKMFVFFFIQMRRIRIYILILFLIVFDFGIFINVE